MPARRALNIVFSMAVENMDQEQRREFEAGLGLGLLEWRAVQVAQAKEKIKRRQDLAAAYGEVG